MPSDANYLKEYENLHTIVCLKNAVYSTFSLHPLLLRMQSLRYSDFTQFPGRWFHTPNLVQRSDMYSLSTRRTPWGMVSTCNKLHTFAVYSTSVSVHLSCDHISPGMVAYTRSCSLSLWSQSHSHQWGQGGATKGGRK